MRKLFALLLIMLAVSSLTFGAGQQEGEDDKIVIGYSIYWLSEFATLMTEAMQEKADREGIELIVLDAQWDAVAQLAHVDNFISQDVDAIIVGAADVYSMVQGVEAANDAGIPFVGVNMRIPTEDIDAYAGPDDVRAGEMMVEYAISQLGENFNCIVLEGAEGYSATVDRREGVKNALDAHPGINALDIKTANWTREGALELVENYIQDFGDSIDAIIAHNDEMALGAIQALEAENMLDDVIVTGIDAIYDACVAVDEGKMEYTVFQDAKLEGSLAFDAAVTLINGGQPEIKENYIDMIGLTKENIKEYLDAFNK